MYNSVLFRFPKGPHHNHVNLILFCISDDFNVRRSTLNHIHTIFKVTNLVLILFFQGLVCGLLNLFIVEGLAPLCAFRDMLVHNMSAIGIRGVWNMQDMQFGIIFFRHVKCMKKGDVGVFGKIRTK